MGVRRAVELAVDEAKRSDSVCVLGPLIHNPRVLSDLKALGIKIVDDDSNDDAVGAAACVLDDYCSVIIRAHGISPSVEEKLRRSGARIIDATCPNVKANQLKVYELVREGYYLFLAGELGHAEVTGLVGYARLEPPDNERCFVVSNASEARKKAFEVYKSNNDAKTALLGQTTISNQEYYAIGEGLKIFFPNLEIVSAICFATEQRQQALRELLPMADAFLIAGGKASANTRRLFEIAKESGKPCALVESASEIPVEFFDYESVGLCAGASTPDSVIEEIENLLLQSRRKF